MVIHDPFGQSTSIYPQQAHLILADGRTQNTTFSIPEEHCLSVSIQHISAFQILCTPSDLPALILGRLYTERLITEAEDVVSIDISSNGASANVTLRKPPHIHLSSITDLVTTCVSKQKTVTSFSHVRPLQSVSPLPWQVAWIQSLISEFYQDTPIHRVTRGTHSCMLAHNGKILYCLEDLGRHNALDKVIGTALLNKIDLTKTMLMTSGRVPTDMVTKVIAAGIPVFISKAVPTLSALQLAQRYALTLVCGASAQKFMVLADAMTSRCV